MNEETEQQKEVIGCIHFMPLNTNQSWKPKRIIILLITLEPPEAAELEEILDNDDHLQQNLKDVRFCVYL